jgi:proline racemase
MKPTRMLPFIDAHACGEPSRILTASHLLLRGDTMADRLQYAKRELDWLRHLVLREPRGFPPLCAVIVTPPCDPRADIGLIVLEQAGFRPMSGSNTMCTVTALLETGLLPVTEPRTRVMIDTAVGLVAVEATVHDGSVTDVAIHNVPAFVHVLDHPLEVPELGTVPVDVAFGGQYFVQLRAADVGVELVPAAAKQIARVGALIKLAAREQIPVKHPDNPDINDIDLVMLHGPTSTAQAHARNAVVMANAPMRLDAPETWTGSLDRSPCGTGTCARMAVLHERGELEFGQRFVHESLTGGLFTGYLSGPAAADRTVAPVIAGRAHVTAMGQLVLDRDDPFAEGFTVADIWAQ